MTQQDDITQRVLTDDEIQALWDEACKDSPQAPGWNRHIRYGRAIESALLSKLRAPVADERVQGAVLKKARDALELTLATAQQFEKQASKGTGGRRGGPVFEKARAAIAAIDAALASAPVAELRLEWSAKALYDAIKDVLLNHRLSNLVDEDGEFFPLVDHLCSQDDKTTESGEFEIALICDAIYNDVLTKSAPVAGEAVYTLSVKGVFHNWKPTTAAFSIPDGEHQLFLSPAAPQASAEDEWKAAIRKFMDTAIPALAAIANVHTPDEIDALEAMPREPVIDQVRRLSQACEELSRQVRPERPKADKYGGRQRAGEVLFWYRPRSDGWYEGPIHNDRIEEARKVSGVWVPLVAAPQASALNAEYTRGRADGFDAGHSAALEKAAAALEDHRKAGREWVPGSLWDTLSREAAARIRALKAQADKDGGQQRAGDGKEPR